MRPFTLAELAALTGGRLCGTDATVTGAAIDSRAVVPGDLFAALAGSRVDGHAFLARAREAGAAAALVSGPVDDPLPQLLVDDVPRALGQFARANRELYTAPLVGITGSCGKTTVKGMLAAVLGGHGPTLATEGNLNNELGVPLSLLRLAPEHAFAVIELGARGIGHIAYLCELARPTVSVLLNAMEAHLEFFGSVDGVARGKGEIFDGLPADGFAVVNADQSYRGEWTARAARTGATVLTFGLVDDADCRASAVALRGDAGSAFTLHTPAGEAAVELAVPGGHNVANALAAAAVAHACGLAPAAISTGLSLAGAVDGRLVRHSGRGGVTVIDDCYNASPGSVRAAIDLLASCAGPTVLALGAMLELGEASDGYHAEMGRRARERGIDVFVGVGDAVRPALEAFGPGGHWYATREQAAAAADDWAGTAATVLVKGSRSAGMELVLQALLPETSEAACS
ncbi:UDP-N-acetylmuramoylalanyl-D-glutamyl-2,6- diaminopimelate--D-alanyl-D-alanine ligase [Pseudohaliea rubra DSM 19751]|uniref:UDP-N-acetylmuramoyl-tripeptide--D-alanyl-D-alanine ligase n=2 Tax=Pseudohaliea TaxID=1341120 RepID=A0A095VPE8_9GAMM|nr:UDP-N-acetylmuramoylalanyl-D-glutamyl-2,6- diaminopimelate--D-alanyl-D-alanine ligase [Pseudohaliea rubra DSM 19751]